jgi:TRAP-type uncharacterized transport system substrate-binding protein
VRRHSTNAVHGVKELSNSKMSPLFLAAADATEEAIYNSMFCATDLVYLMTKQLFENLPSMVAAHAAAKQIDLQKAAKGSPVPLHPGAAKYYKEKNVGM